MKSQYWNCWGATVTGPYHIKARIPNQDSWVARQYKWGNVVVVSDGLGSKAHSNFGSKAACLATLEAAKSFQKKPKAKNKDILRLIHANWLVKIAPYSPRECSTTCLFAIQNEELITLGRLGDGMIAVYGYAENDNFILSQDKEDSFSNLTNCLDRSFKPIQWETKIIKVSKCRAIVLCTDGISDDLLKDKQMMFVQKLYDTYANMESKERARDIRRWLKNWPVLGHTDDKTIAGLFKKEGSL